MPTGCSKRTESIWKACLVSFLKDHLNTVTFHTAHRPGVPTDWHHPRDLYCTQPWATVHPLHRNLFECVPNPVRFQISASSSFFPYCRWISFGTDTVSRGKALLVLTRIDAGLNSGRGLIPSPYSSLKWKLLNWFSGYHVIKFLISRFSTQYP
jgi:hypothetical protein